MTNNHIGKVYLVGSGPGDPDLITVKAHRLISECDALVYDSLVPKEVLQIAKDRCDLTFVGKRRGHHSFPQAKINAVLLEKATRYECVVRLKGGDPFVFGRGGEEAAYLHIHKVPIEVVPGVTAGIAAPAYLGIPVTHRHAGSSVTFITGHELVDQRRPSVKWKSLAQASDSLVIYMGLHNLEHIVSSLLSGGMDSNIPAVVIQQATVVGQNFIKAPLHKLVEEVRQKNLSSPSIVVIGRIVDYQVTSCAPSPANVTMPIPF